MISFAIIGLVGLLSFVSGEETVIPIPKNLTIVEIYSRSVDIRVVPIDTNEGQLFSCSSNAVQFKLTAHNKTAWESRFPRKLPNGRFVLIGLEPKNSYQVRVACKVREGEMFRTGEFSEPVTFETLAPEGNQDLQNSGKDSLSSRPNYYSFLILYILALYI